MEDFILSIINLGVGVIADGEWKTPALIATGSIAACATIARELDTPAESASWAHKFVYKLINKLAMNSKKAINADDFLAKRR